MLQLLSEAHIAVTVGAIAHRLNEITQDMINHQARVRLSGTISDEMIEDILHKAKESRILAEVAFSLAPIISEPEAKEQAIEMAQHHLENANFILNTYQKACEHVSNQNSN